jgi:hypothetical protein
VGDRNRGGRSHRRDRQPHEQDRDHEPGDCAENARQREPGAQFGAQPTRAEPLGLEITLDEPIAARSQQRSQ